MRNRIAVGLAALWLAGCASTQIDAQWTNPDYSGRHLRGAPVLVVCEAQEPTLQRICEDQVASQISAMGGTPTRASQLAGSNAPPAAGTDPYVAAARRIGARAIVRTTLTTGAFVAGPSGPTIGIGVGGGGGSVGGFGGISFPIGGTRVSSAYASETAMIDPANGAIMWSARASSSASQDTTAQIAELAKTAAEAIKQAGFF
ncbi:MAG: hypothetical protein ACXW2G_13825 [Burkholderiaceae bacterium]